MNNRMNYICLFGAVILTFAASAADKVETEVVEGVEYSFKPSAAGVTIIGLKKLANADPNRLVVPRVLGGKKVKLIGDEAFCDDGSFMWNGQKVITAVSSFAQSRGGGSIGFKVVVLPNGLESIGAKAFYQCADIVEVVIPDSVFDIGEEAFCGCLSLKKVDIPPGLETIPRGLFKNTGLVSVEVPEGVTQIKQEAFCGCKDLWTIRIPNSVVEIGDEAFKDCERLEKPALPENLKTGRNTFEGCFKYAVGDDGVLFETEAKEEDAVVIKKIKMPASLTVLEIPEKITGKVVVGIADGAISDYRDREFERVLIPRTVISLDKYLLWKFKNARVIKLLGVENIDDEIFGHFKRLESVEIPSASKIGRRVFRSCSSLTNVVLSASLMEIPYAAFKGCKSLGKIDLPIGVKVIGDYAFQGCAKLQIESFPESLKSIGYGAFEGCAKISRVAFAEGFETLGPRAFKGCSSLTEVYIPDSVKELPFALFCDCENLRAVRQPQDIVHGCDVFKGCEKVPEECKVDAKERKRRAEAEERQRRKESEERERRAEEAERQKRTTFKDAGDVKTEVVDGIEYAFLLSPVGAKIVGLAKLEDIASKKLAIPSKLGGKKVTIIDDEAFCDGRTVRVKGQRMTFSTSVPDDGKASFGFETVVLPKGLESIGAKAFYQCADIVEINMPDSVINIGEEAFYGCQSLKSVSMPSGIEIISAGMFKKSGIESIEIPESVVEIKEYAFEDAKDLSKIIVPDNVKKIGERAFSSCSGISLVRLPKGLAVLENGLFEHCTGLASFDFPLWTTQIGNGVFEGCTSLKSIVIPVGVTEIGRRAFKGCSSLEEVELPPKITSIRYATFRDCVALRSIVIPNSVKEIEASAFDDCESMERPELSASVEIDDTAFHGCFKGGDRRKRRENDKTAELSEWEKKRIERNREMEKNMSKIDDVMHSFNARMKVINEKVERGEYMKEALQKIQEDNLKGR